MPTLELKTNVPVADPKTLMKEFAPFAAQLLGKPLEYISTSYTYNETLTFAGTFDPAFVLNIVSLGNINPEANLVYSQKLFAFFGEKLGVPGDRAYITFVDPGNSNIGFKSTHFGVIFGNN
ncbi:Tautomerase/MIF superfamily [Cristinia sonorae]|uniref:L-dopachrome isomerase n=1 Tax=Cristinia sonorae TaxID=1940300 RepID=A0A8K0XPF8_9AGAR|nr:Tautomerase/MIF superfamily [Cristinia sonorae]